MRLPRGLLPPRNDNQGYFQMKLLGEKRTLIMGILNVTPDSFYDGGKYSTLKDALKRAEEMVEEGADIIDVGGESTRPGSLPVSEQEEISRVEPVIKELTKLTGGKIPVSVDTYKSKVAERSIDSGAQMVNDISGLSFDDRMASLVSKKKVPVIVMHIKGTPKNMQEKPYYRDVISEITGYFAKRIKYALSKGIKKENIILDPGIGFGKTTAHNLTILKNLKKFSGLGFKLAIGTSRKSFIGKILGSEQKPLPADERLEGSIVTALIAAQEGVKILRVHDVRETKKALRIFEEIRSIQ